MWFYPLSGLLVILAIIGGTVAGGVFTLVLIPLAVVAAVSAVVYATMGRAPGGRGRRSRGGRKSATSPPPPAPQRTGSELARGAD